MSAIGRIVGGFFGSGTPRVARTPMPAAPAPNIGDAGGEAAARLARAKLQRRRGLEDTILTSSLGSVGAGSRAGPQVRSLLG